MSRYLQPWHIRRYSHPFAPKLNATFPFTGVNKTKTTAASSAASKISHHLATFGSSSEDPQKQIETSGFSTKDSSDSKSHDSGIDSIEKPGTFNFYNAIFIECHWTIIINRQFPNRHFQVFYRKILLISFFQISLNSIQFMLRPKKVTYFKSTNCK